MAAEAGLVLDPWQQLVLVESLGERQDGKWSAFEVGLVVSRQNGKGAILEARELAGLFLLGERLILHSAHEYKTAQEGFLRIRALIEGNPTFSKRVKAVRTANGEQGIELMSGARLRFVARSKGSGRGFSADCLILDEAMDLPEEAHSALLPTLSARPNPQVWYTGSAVDREVHSNGVVLTRIRERGLAGDDPSLAYFEWSADASLDALIRDRSLAQSPQLWAQGNPGLGLRIPAEFVAGEQRSMSARSFAVERLSVGDWPSTDAFSDRVVDPVAWRECGRPDSVDTEPVFALDVTPLRTRGAICAARGADDGLVQVGLVESGPGTSWMVGRCVALKAERPSARFVVDPRGPAASLLVALADAGITCDQPSPQEYSRACNDFMDRITDRRLVYPLPQPELDVAVDGAAIKPTGDSWAWSRRLAKVDISPLVAATLALWGHNSGAVQYTNVAYGSDVVPESHEPVRGPGEPRFISQAEYTTRRT